MTKVCEWTQDYSVGITVLDRHHHKLFDIINELFNLMEQGAEDRSIFRVLDELIEYTHYHFEEEEAIMEKMGYPDLAAHKVLHQQLIKILKDYYEEAKSGMAIFVAIKVANAGLEWLKNHIKTVDHKYYEYMKEQGLQL